MKKQSYTKKEIITMFHIDQISTSDFMKQYRDFKTIPHSYGNIINLDESHNVILEDAERTVPPENVKEIIQKEFRLDSWQVNIEIAENDVRVLYMIADLGNNQKMLEDAMNNLGWFLVGTENANFNAGGTSRTNWIILWFDPMFQADVSEVVMKKEALMHWTPYYNYHSIMKNGLVPKSENKKGDHPDRVYFFPSDVSYEDGRRLGQSICYSNKDQRNDGRYVLLFIETKDLKGFSFCYDPHTQQSYYTTQTIPPEVIQLVGGYDYSKHKQFNVI